MFRKDKDISERSQTLLKNKEIKQLKAELLKQFRFFEDHPEELERFLPNKCDLTCIKLVNRTLLYSMNGTTLLFDVEGRNNLFLTVSTLRIFPSLLPCLSTWGPVSRFVMKGADFMIPGLAQSASWDERVQMNGKCALKIVGNPLPFAVGISLVDGSILNSQNQKGKAMLVYHNYGDFLTTKIPPLNEGFTLKEIKPTEGDLTAGEGQSYDEGEEEEAEEQQGTHEITGDLKTMELTKPSAIDETDGSAETGKNCEAENQGNEEIEGHEKEGEVKKSISQYDEELLETLIITLKYIIKGDKPFPLLISSFWPILQRCVKDDNTIIDIKKTSFRKVHSFLVDYCEKKLHLLETREDENHNLFLISVNRENELFGKYKVSDIESFRMKVKQREQSSLSVHEDGLQKVVPSSSTATARSDKYVIMELYKIPKKLREIFSKDSLLSNGAENGEYYKANEIKELLIRYITLHRLENPEKRSSLILTSDDDLYEYCSFDKKDKATSDSCSSSSSVILKPSAFPPLKSESSSTSEAASLSAVHERKNGFSSVSSSSSSNSSSNRDTNYQNNFPTLGFSTSPSKTASGSSSDATWRKNPDLPLKPPANPPPSAPTSSVSQPKKKDASALIDVPINEEEIKINEISKEEFMKSILSKLTLYHGIIPPSTGIISIHSGIIPKIKILTEHRMGNKMVTVIRGLDYYQIDLITLSKQCQKK
jgi:predicted ribosome-associated RNA-binding protein Tma20